MFVFTVIFSVSTFPILPVYAVNQFVLFCQGRVVKLAPSSPWAATRFVYIPAENFGFVLVLVGSLVLVIRVILILQYVYHLTVLSTA